MAPKKKRLSREELLQKKREAERLRYKTRKNDPQKREEMREKEKLKYQKKKEKGLRKLVKDMTPREHRATLKKWREHCSNYRTKRLRLKRIADTFVRENTPLSDPEVNTPLVSPVPICLAPSPAVSSASHQQRKKEGEMRRKKYNRERNEKIACLEKQVAKYKKRLARIEKKYKKHVVDTPKTKILKMLDEPNQRKEVVTKALFSDVISKQLKDNYSTLKRTKEKQIFKNVVTANVIRKYRVGHMSVGDLILQFLGNAGRGAAEGMLLAASLPGNLVAMEPYTGAQRAFCVRAYYENNKSVITARRLYRHEHGLRDLSGVPSANVIRKWIRMFETTGSTISITARGRAVSARSADIVERKLLEDLCCDRYNVDYLARPCHTCLNKNPKYREFDNRNVIKYKIINFALKTKWTVEEIFTDSEPENLESAQPELTPIPNKSVQRLDDAIAGTSEIESISFSSVSPCLRHDASAVFAHLKVALVHMINHQQIKVLHIVSDGPSSQYKNKNNIYLFTQHLVHILGITEATWNVTERSHGKGPADEVGAAIKETANKYVLGGNDTPDYSTFLQVFKSKSNDLLYEECQSEIESAEELLKTAGQLKIIPGVKNCHQITWNRQEPRTVHLRDLTQFVLH
ncbi:hypothetical protein ACJJTC_016042 [Scirpophaga incertulas]